MLEQRTLADIIQSKVALGHANARGFFDVRCPMCHDQKDRGGFKFDTEFCGYSCYNCGAKFKYEEGTGKLSRNAREILEAFGITKDDLTAIRSAMFQQPKEEAEVTLDELKKVKLITPEVPLPEKSHPIGADHHEELQLLIAEYLDKRKIDAIEVHAHFSLDPRFLNRVILPYYRDGKIIFWQARAIFDDMKPRYLNSPIARDAVMYGYDRLYSYDPAPLFVNEGVFDAVVLNGISILGSSLNAAKIEVLKKCRRRVIFVIDRDKTGGELMKQVLDNGWEISFVDKRAGDANKSVQMFGLPYTIYTLMKNVTRSPVLGAMGVMQGKLGAYR
jgi:hypothetical protein